MSSAPRKNHGGSSGPFLILSNLVLVACVLLLAVQNRRLQGRLDEALTAAAFNQQTTAFRAGESIPDLPVITHDREKSTLAIHKSSGATLLFVSTSGCEACDEVKPVWNTLSEALKSTSVDVVGINLPSEATLQSSTSGGEAHYETYTLALTDPLLLNKFRALPAALLVDSNGAIIGAWYGSVQAKSMQPILDAAMRIASSDARANTE